MMRMSVKVFAVASLLSLTVGAQAASFNCKKASNATERAICASPSLNEADTKLSNTYDILQGFVDDSRALKYEQLQWLRGRNECGSRVACIREEYQYRQRQLQQRIANYQGG